MEIIEIVQELKKIRPDIPDAKLKEIADKIEKNIQEKIDFLFSLSKVKAITQSNKEREIEKLQNFIVENGLEKSIVYYGTKAEIESRCKEIERNRSRYALNSIIALLNCSADTMLTEDIKQLLSEAMQNYTPTDSGENIINQSRATKALIKREAGEIILGTNIESGEAAIMQIISGYITPYEKEILECISKFKHDGQTTENGKIWFTLGQLYRALRHGAGTTRPQIEQKEALLAALTELSKPERKLNFKLNDYLKIWGGFETNGGKIRILSFDELYGKIRGQEDILIIMDNTPFICAIAENLKMYEVINQNIKSIKEIHYTLVLKEPIQINGKTVRKRSFKTDRDREIFCKKNKISNANIEKCSKELKPFPLSENRIALRAVILDFVYGYIRARAINRQYSNKLPYSFIYEVCKIDIKSREIIKRTKADIAVILNHLVSCSELPELKAWKEYTNKHSKKADGIQIFLQLPELPESEA